MVMALRSISQNLTITAKVSGVDLSKFCPRCTTVKAVSEFGRSAARYDGLTGWCMACQREAVLTSTRKRRAALVALLGSACAECGFSDPRALHIDHVNGDGAEERRRTGNSSSALAKLVRQSPDRYQLLCANCNEIKKWRMGEVGTPSAAPTPSARSKAAYQRAANAAARAEILGLIGSCCRRCHFGTIGALHVDHVSGGGNDHRRSDPGFRALLRSVRADPDLFQPLCANCNRIKQAEDGEYKGSREYQRVKPTERRRAPETWKQRTPEAADRRQAELVRLIELRRPLERLPERDRTSWTGFYTRCLGCHSTTSRHAANGVCDRCYKVATGRTRTAKASSQSG